MMLLFLLFVSAAAQCESGTCSVCKNMSGCDWYGWDCYNKSDSAVTILGLNVSATCDTCQAASCGECQAQSGCSWFKSDSPNSPGTCALTGSSVNSFTQLDVCPSCDIHTTCDACSAANDTCSWYFRGNTGKCREAAPSFTYSKGLLGYCGIEPCAQTTCSSCQLQVSGREPLCTWYSSKNPVFYGPRCGSVNNSGLSAAFYTPESSLTCPVCSSTICSACKAEDNCKWVALEEGSRQRFRQCLASSAGTPANKSEIGICNCALHSCQQCQTNTSCSWFTGGMKDDCDMTSEADVHLGQAAATTCPACAADRCFECNGLAGCGWYADIILGVILREGCYPSSNYPSGRTLLNNSNPRCKGVPNTTAPSSSPTSSAPTPAAVTSSSALVVASSVTVAVLVLLA